MATSTEFQDTYDWVLPAGELHFSACLAIAPEMFGRQVYQPERIEAVLEVNWSRRIAIGVGAHIGFWSHYLAKYIPYAHAIELVAGHAESFRQT